MRLTATCFYKIVEYRPTQWKTNVKFRWIFRLIAAFPLCLPLLSMLSIAIYYFYLLQHPGKSNYL